MQPTVKPVAAVPVQRPAVGLPQRAWRRHAQVGALAHAAGMASHTGGGSGGQPGHPCGQMPASGRGQMPGGRG